MKKYSIKTFDVSTKEKRELLDIFIKNTREKSKPRRLTQPDGTKIIETTEDIYTVPVEENNNNKLRVVVKKNISKAN